MVKHFLSLDKVSTDFLKSVLKTSFWIKKVRFTNLLAGKKMAMLFHKPSTRTRVSFQVGFEELGGRAYYLEAGQLQLSRGETPQDTARVLSRYVDMVVIRTYSQEFIEDFAQASDIPVINALTDLLHPCQILSDIFSIIEKKGKIEGLKITYVGDGNNIANSWINAARHFDFKLTISCPEGYDPDEEILKKALSEGAKIDIERNPQKAAKDADVLYTDVWASMGKEAEAEERKKVFKPYQLNSKLVAMAKPECLVMHCLPAHRGEEITDEVMDGKNSIVFDQAENRLHVQKALILHLFEVV